MKQQIQLFSQIYMTLARFRILAISSRFYEDLEESIKEINELIKANCHLLTPEILKTWLETLAILDDFSQEKDPVNKAKLIDDFIEKFQLTSKLVSKYANTVLIPKYKKIVGDSVGPMDTGMQDLIKK